MFRQKDFKAEFNFDSSRSKVKDSFLQRNKASEGFTLVGQAEDTNWCFNIWNLNTKAKRKSYVLTV